MELAAPATLEVTLNEKWDADRVLYCIYEDEQDMVIDAIKMCKNAVINSKLQPYQATRNATVFAQIQNDANQ